MLSEQEWETIETNAQAEWENVMETTPDDKSQGFYSYGDAPAGIGGGMGCFAWFEDREAMLNFIEDVLPFNPPGPCTKDHLATQKAVKEATQVHRKGESTLEELRQNLNKVLRSYSQIEWFGSFLELKAGKAEFATSLIQRFRDDDEESAEVSPIGPDEQQEFIDFLGECGI